MSQVHVCFYFEVHQPWRLKKYSFWDIGHDHDYFDLELNRSVFLKVAQKCYWPATRLLEKMVHRYNPRFRFSFSLTKTFLDQAYQFDPALVEQFQKLAQTGCVEFLTETSHHSLSSLLSEEEFFQQVRLHQKTMTQVFSNSGRTFRNTELIFSDHIAWLVHQMNFDTIITEGEWRLLKGRSPNFLYKAEYLNDMKLMLKNFTLSDDIAFRFSQRSWKEFPLTAEKFSHWLHQVAGNGETINLFMDYETFGEHQWADTGIFSFLENLPEHVFKHPDYVFSTVSEASKKIPVRGSASTFTPISWADMERDLSAWRGNALQETALAGLYELEQTIKSKGDEGLLETFRRLSTSDHFYYMCIKYFQDGDVHKYFSPYETPHEGYLYFMNVLEDLRQRL